MPEFALLETETWRDGDFCALTSDARLIFLWAWTNPHAAICGLYRLHGDPARSLLRAIGPCDPPLELHARIECALGELEQKPMMLLDPRAGVLWVCERARRSLLSAKAQKIMLKEYARVPDSPLKEAFADRYGEALGIPRHQEVAR